LVSLAAGCTLGTAESHKGLGSRVGVASHLELEAEEQQESGLPLEEARYAARRAFGNATLVQEDARNLE